MFCIKIFRKILHTASRWFFFKYICSFLNIVCIGIWTWLKGVCLIELTSQTTEPDSQKKLWHYSLHWTLYTSYPCKIYTMYNIHSSQCSLCLGAGEEQKRSILIFILNVRANLTCCEAFFLVDKKYAWDQSWIFKYWECKI